MIKKTLYELLNEIKPFLSHLKVFGCKCFVLYNGKDGFKKFYFRSDKDVFVGYSSTKKAHKVINKRTQCVEESVHVVSDEADDLSKA